MTDTDALAATAERATTAAADYLRERFADGDLEADYGTSDVKTEADVGAETRILAILRDAYPDHAITAEESGHHAGDGPVRWAVDPLDGTNNFAIGSPLFGVAVTAIGAEGHPQEGESLATAMAVPTMNEIYVATRGGGARLNGERISAEDGDGVDPSHATAASLIGQPVLNSSALMDDHRDMLLAVRGEIKRVIDTWAPVVYFGLLAKGGLDAFMSFHADEREQAAGALLAREAGCVERSEGPLTVFADDTPTADCVFDAARRALEDDATS